MGRSRIYGTLTLVTALSFGAAGTQSAGDLVAAESRTD